MVWDLGGNDGRFSRVALEAGAGKALCFDVDPVAVEKSYRQVRAHKETGLLPLLLDLTNPTPAIGWGHEERRSVEQRAQPGTMLMALAVIHHQLSQTICRLDALPNGLPPWESTSLLSLCPRVTPKSRLC
jgi:hypothetical protein